MFVLIMIILLIVLYKVLGAFFKYMAPIIILALFLNLFGFSDHTMQTILVPVIGIYLVLLSIGKVCMFFGRA